MKEKEIQRGIQRLMLRVNHLCVVVFEGPGREHPVERCVHHRCQLGHRVILHGLAFGTTLKHGVEPRKASFHRQLLQCSVLVL